MHAPLLQCHWRGTFVAGIGYALRPMAERANPSRDDDQDAGGPPAGGRGERLDDAVHQRDVDLNPLAAGRNGSAPQSDRGHEPATGELDEAGYAPVPLAGGSDVVDEVLAEDPAGPAPDPARGRSAASVRASMRPRDPWRRPADEQRGRAQTRPWASGQASLVARLLTAAAVVAAVVGVLMVAGSIELGGGEPGSSGGARANALSVERERANRLEAALRRESGQRQAWEMWAREFDRKRYQKLKRRAAARVREASDDTGG